MKRSIDDISKDLATATSRKNALSYSNTHGLSIKERAALTKETAEINLIHHRLMLELQKWVEAQP